MVSLLFFISIQKKRSHSEWICHELNAVLPTTKLHISQPLNLTLVVLMSNNYLNADIKAIE